jgi:hypothetical protein
MNWTVTVYSAILFFLLSPGILLSLPSKGGKYTIAIVHSIVFAIVWHLTHKHVWKMSVNEGLTLDHKRKPVVPVVKANPIRPIPKKSKM